MILAQIQQVDARHVVDFLLIGGFLLNTAVMVVGLVRSNRSQRREVSFADEFIRKGECALVHDAAKNRVEAVEKAVGEIRRGLNELNHANEQRASELHRRLNSLEEAMGQMPDRVVALLMNSHNLLRSRKDEP